MNQLTWNHLSCSLTAQVATLTTNAGKTEAHPKHAALHANGIIAELAANAAEFFQNNSKYTVIIRKET